MTKRPEQMVDNLTRAIIASSNAPVLLLDGDLSVISASASFCAAFQIMSDDIVGRFLASLGAGEWNIPQLTSLLHSVATGRVSVDACEMDLKRAGREVRHLMLHVRKPDYGDPESIRLLVAVVDKTDARRAEKQKQSLIHEKNMLFQ